MAWKPLLLLALFILVSPVFAAPVISEWNVNVVLNNDRTSSWNIVQSYNETINHTEYFMRAAIKEYAVTADGNPAQCHREPGVGTLVICDGFNARNISYSFVTDSIIIDILDNFKLFTHRTSIDKPTQYYRVAVKLPIGSILADENELRGGLKPFEPAYGQQSSDGRFIFVTWERVNPQENETIDLSIVYERVGEENNDILIFGGIIVAIILAGIAAFFFVRRRPIQDMLPVLTEAERRVVEILIREKKPVDQRLIVKETDFSKAKVSRVIHDLSQRGVIEKISKGRKNIIKLRKAVKVPKTEPPKTDEKKGEI